MKKMLGAHMINLKKSPPEQLIFQLKIVITDSKPEIFRTLQVPVDITFHDLHNLIQQAFAWQNEHLYEFSFRFDNRRYLQISTDLNLEWEKENEVKFEDMPVIIENGMQYLEVPAFFGNEKTVKIQKPRTIEDFLQIHYPEFMLFDKLDSQHQRLSDFVRVGQVFVYMYDFGDNWEHQILCESLMVRQKRVRYPVCSEGAGNHLFENCGGIDGYYEILNILNDPKHEEYSDLTDWLVTSYGKGILKYSPNEFDLSKVKLK